jgi:hypothetical protein
MATPPCTAHDRLAMKKFGASRVLGEEGGAGNPKSLHKQTTNLIGRHNI